MIACAPQRFENIDEARAQLNSRRADYLAVGEEWGRREPGAVFANLGNDTYRWGTGSSTELEPLI